MQSCARQVLGEQPVEFPEMYKSICNGMYAYLFSSQDHDARQMIWSHTYGLNQWWIDAFTVDPSRMLEDMQGLWEHGTPQPVTRTKLENANVGTLPSISVYIAVHPTHGTHAFFPFHGAKHGSTDKDSGDKKLYKNFEFWYSKLDACVLAKIVKLNYCNTPAALEEFSSRASASEQKAFKDEGKFDPRFFLVCPNMCMFLEIREI